MSPLLNDFDHTHVLSALVEAARAEGYTIRKIKRLPFINGITKEHYERYSARNDERGIKFAFELTLRYIRDQITVKIIRIEREVRDYRGRFLKSTGDQLRITKDGNNRLWFGRPDGTWRSWLGDAIEAIKSARGETVTKPQVKTADGLASFPPLKFDKPAYVWGKPDDNAGPPIYSFNCFYKWCRVRGIATILPDLKVSVDEACQPGADPWFYITGECMAKRSGARSEIIVNERDGALVFYPVRNDRVTNDLTPLNTYIDYSQITELDAVLVEKAIAKFLEGVG